jgi:hypothetical protein
LVQSGSPISKIAFQVAHTQEERNSGECGEMRDNKNSIEEQFNLWLEKGEKRSDYREESCAYLSPSEEAIELCLLSLPNGHDAQQSHTNV